MKGKFNHVHMNICHLFLMSDQTNSPNIKYIETFDLCFAHLKYFSNCLSLVVADKMLCADNLIDVRSDKNRAESHWK